MILRGNFHDVSDFMEYRFSITGIESATWNFKIQFLACEIEKSEKLLFHVIRSMLEGRIND